MPQNDETTAAPVARVSAIRGNDALRLNSMAHEMYAKTFPASVARNMIDDIKFVNDLGAFCNSVSLSLLNTEDMSKVINKVPMSFITQKMGVEAADVLNKDLISEVNDLDNFLKPRLFDIKLIKIEKDDIKKDEYKRFINNESLINLPDISLFFHDGKKKVMIRYNSYMPKVISTIPEFKHKSNLTFCNVRDFKLVSIDGQFYGLTRYYYTHFDIICERCDLYKDEISVKSGRVRYADDDYDRLGFDSLILDVERIYNGMTLHNGEPFNDNSMSGDFIVGDTNFLTTVTDITTSVPQNLLYIVENIFVVLNNLLVKNFKLEDLCSNDESFTLVRDAIQMCDQSSFKYRRLKEGLQAVCGKQFNDAKKISSHLNDLDDDLVSAIAPNIFDVFFKNRNTVGRTYEDLMNPSAAMLLRINALRNKEFVAKFNSVKNYLTNGPLSFENIWTFLFSDRPQQYIAKYNLKFPNGPQGVIKETFDVYYTFKSFIIDLDISDIDNNRDDVLKAYDYLGTTVFLKLRGDLGRFYGWERDDAHIKSPDAVNNRVNNFDGFSLDRVSTSSYGLGDLQMFSY